MHWHLPEHTRHRMIVFFYVLALVIALAVALLATPAAAQGDVDNGAVMAVEWCAACHLIETGPPPNVADGAPPFKTVAGYDDARLRTWLTAPHPPMPDFNLSRSQIDDIMAYLRSLRED